MGKRDRLKAKKKRETKKFLKDIDKQAKKMKLKIKVVQLKEKKYKKKKARKEF